MKTLTTIFLTLLFLSSPVLRAQLTVRINAIDTTNFPTIVVKAKIMEDNIRVPDISTSEAQLRENGILQAIQIDCPASSVSIMLILDKSTSMVFFPNTRIRDPDSTRWKSAKGALTQFIDMMSQQDQAGFISFNGNIDLDQDFTSNKTALKDAVFGIALGPYTAVWAAANFGVDLLSVRPDRRAIVLLTDGEDNSSAPVTLPSLIANAQQHSVRIFTVGLGEDIGRSGLDSLAQLTGGKFFFSATGEDLSDIYRSIVQEIGDDCTITYTSLLFCPDGTRRDILLDVNRNTLRAVDDTFYMAPSNIANFQLFTPRTVLTSSGGNISVPLQLDHAIPIGIPVNATCTLAFDTSVMAYTGIDSKGTLSEQGTIQVQQSANVLAIQTAIAVTKDSSSVLCNVLFHVKDTYDSKASSLRMLDAKMKLRCEPNLSISGGNILIDGACNKLILRRKNLLFQNTPNPFNPTTVIRYVAKERQQVRFTVFNLIGKKVFEDFWMTNEGEQTYAFDGKNLPSGIYTYRMYIGEWSDAKRMLLVK